MASLLIIFNLSFSLSLVLHLLTPSCTAPIALSSASMASPWRRRWFSMCRVERGGEGEKDDAFVFFFSPLLSRLKVKKRRESIDQKKEIRSIAPFSLSLFLSFRFFTPCPGRRRRRRPTRSSSRSSSPPCAPKRTRRCVSRGEQKENEKKKSHRDARVGIFGQMPPPSLRLCPS